MEETQYIVTLSMPIYNVEQCVERALLSALAQTFDSIEFLIVDDRGQDKSMEIVRKIQREHPRGIHIRIVEHDVNSGLGKARNTAIEEAKGRYIYFMDSDDYITPETIEVLYREVQKQDVDVVIASEFEERKGNVYPRMALPVCYSEGELAIAKWMALTHLYFPIHTWNKLYSISFLRENNIRCIVGHMVEDTWFTFQVVMKARSVKSIPVRTYYYYINPSSHSRQQRDERFFQQYIEIFDARKRLMECGNKKYPRVIYNYFLQPFFSFFLRETIFKTEKGRYCLDLQDKLSEIFQMDFEKSDLIGFRYKMIYSLFRKKNFWLLKYFYLTDDKVCGAYKKINKIIKFSHLPYQHL